MMRVLVTGADGFIGSHLTEMLLNKGYKVRALSFYNSFNHLGWLEGISHENLEVISGDIRDPYICNSITQNIDVIFHLAALIAIPYSYTASDSYLETNVRGTLNICQAAKENKVNKILITSTSEVYGTAQYVPIDEKHLKNPQSPYSATKISADAIALSFYYSFNLPVVIVRPFNTYGPRQSSRAIIPTIITQLANGIKSLKLGNLSPTRDFNYVKDVCRAFIGLANCNEAVGQEINIASSTEISIKDILLYISQIMEVKVNVEEDKSRVRPLKSEVLRLFGDNYKIKSLINYVPQYSLKEGLEETITWFLNPDNLKMYKYDVYNV